MAKKEIAIDVRLEGGKETRDEVQGLGSDINKVAESSQRASDEMAAGFKAGKEGADAASKGVKGFAGSIKTLAASLGVLALLNEAFQFLKDVLMQNQTIANGVSTAMTALEIVFTQLISKAVELGGTLVDTFSDPKQAVIDLWELIKENFINRLEGVVIAFKAVATVIKATLNADWDTAINGAKDFGSALVQIGTGLTKDDQKALVETIKNFASEVQVATKNAIEQADALVRLRNEVKLLEAGQKELQLTYQREAELQRQIRDDVRLTIEERIAANEELGRILEQQLEVELNVAQKRLELAEAEAARNSENIELQAEVLRARGELADVEERIIGQRSEQLVNEASLEKELFDLREEIRLAELEGRERELAELDSYYDNLAEKARLSGENIFEVEAARGRAINDLKDKFRQEDLKKERDASKTRLSEAQKETQVRLNLASSLATGLSSIVSGLAGQSKAAVAVQKTLAIAQIAIDTARSISSAIASATQSAAATGPGAVVATPIFIATQIATVLGAVGQAIAVLNSAQGGQTASLPSVSPVSASASTPSITPVTTNTTELGNTEQAELMPIQAFVVETELTGNQENVSQIESQATFGG